MSMLYLFLTELPMIARLHLQGLLSHHPNQRHRRLLQHRQLLPLQRQQSLLHPIPTVQQRRHNVVRRLHALTDCAALNGV
jgi:hypothetical protein